MPQKEIKHQLTIACLDTMRVFEQIKDASKSSGSVKKIEEAMNELNDILNELNQIDPGIDALKLIAKRINQVSKEVIDAAK